MISRKPPGSSQSPIRYQQLHSNFGAEASGVDFANVTSADVDQIKAGLAEVSRSSV